MTNHDTGKLFGTLKLNDSFKDLEYGGVIDELLLVLRIPASKKNTKDLKTMFGNDFKKVFTTEFFSDVGIDSEATDAAEYERTTTIVESNEEGTITTTVEFDGITTVTVVDTDNSGSGITVTVEYLHYRISKRELDKMNGERLSEIVALGLSFYTGTQTPCPNDKLITVVVIIALTVVTVMSAGSAGAPAWAIASIIASSAITIGLQLGVWKNEKTKRNLGYVAAVLSVVGSGGISYNSLATSASLGSAEFINFAATTSLAVLDTTTSIYMTNETYQFNKDITNIETQIANYDELMADQWEQQIRFSFEDVFDSHVRMGHEADPYQSIKEVYSAYSIYD